MLCPVSMTSPPRTQSAFATSDDAHNDLWMRVTPAPSEAELMALRSALSTILREAQQKANRDGRS